MNEEMSPNTKTEQTLTECYINDSNLAALAGRTRMNLASPQRRSDLCHTILDLY